MQASTSPTKGSEDLLVPDSEGEEAECVFEDDEDDALRIGRRTGFGGIDMRSFAFAG